MAVWKKIRSFPTNPGVISVRGGKVVFGKLGNTDELANMEEERSESFKETIQGRLLSILPSLVQRKTNPKTVVICKVMNLSFRNKLQRCF